MWGTFATVEEVSTPAWHAFSVERVFDRVRSAPEGLAHAEALERLLEVGPNALPEAARRGPLHRLLTQFSSPLIYVLVIAAVITLALRDYLDTWVIAAVVVINAAIGFIQEGKAEKALDAVRGLLADQAIVEREGSTISVAAREVVPGDILHVESGSRVPADARIVDSQALTVAEASLTGESQPVEKSSDAVADASPLGERSSMLFAGTLVTSGVGRAVVVETGSSTELGRIGVLVEELGSVRTPLTRRLDRFATQITLVILVVGALAFAWGYFVRDSDAYELFLISVGLVVAAIPEGLPAIVTIVLAIGTRAMARNNALIRRLPAVESLGSVSIIWSDKTGTLTKNEMTVVSVVTGDQAIDVAGVGYVPEGEFSVRGEPITPLDDPALRALLEAGVLCNRSDVRHDDGGEHVPVGDPTEAALIVLARKAGISPVQVRRDHPLVDQVPFESHRQYMATLHATSDGGLTWWVKGAPERVLAMVEATWDGGPIHDSFWNDRVDELAARGQRVLALAGATGAAGGQRGPDDPIPGLRLLGLVGVVDPPSEGAKRAIAACHAAGIRVKMITGDHLQTAAAIGEQLGLRVGQPLSGAEIDQLDDEALDQRWESTDVIARATPEHKLRLVRRSQQAGYQVAMTGDGVNDAPALQAADIGVAMGRGGTDAARSASDLVLTDDRFETIEAAIARGRIVFDNIKKSMLHVLPTDAGEVLIILVALFSGTLLPITASQILWVNLIIAFTVGLALVVEKAEDDLMRRPPRRAREPLLNRRFIARILFIGVLLASTSLAVFHVTLAQGASVEHARAAAVTMLVVGEMFYLFNVRRFTQSGFTIETFLGNKAALGASALLIGLQAAFVYVPQMNVLFGTAPLYLQDLSLIGFLGVAIFLVVEGEKWLWRRAGVSAF